jgi:hypothetical protein
MLPHQGVRNKYAIECMKTALLLLNGGGARALLTFFGNRGKMLTAESADAIGSLSSLSRACHNRYSATAFLMPCQT